MTYRGHVRNGQVVLDAPAIFPEGAEVQVSSLVEGSESASDLVAPTMGPTNAEREPSADVVRRFHQLAVEWKEATLLTSSGTEMLLHPAYQRIIGMGMQAVPLILAELRREPDHWFWALKSITGEDPVANGDRGKLVRMADAWLNWAQQRGY